MDQQWWHSEQLQGLRTVPQRAVKGAGVTQHSLPLLPKTTRSVWRVQSRSPLRVNEGNRHWSSFPLPGQCNSSSAGRAVPHRHLLRLGYGGPCSSAARGNSNMSLSLVLTYKTNVSPLLNSLQRGSIQSILFFKPVHMEVTGPALEM